jgi:hypothetical protein
MQSEVSVCNPRILYDQPVAYHSFIHSMLQCKSWMSVLFSLSNQRTRGVCVGDFYRRSNILNVCMLFMVYSQGSIQERFDLWPLLTCDTQIARGRRKSTTEQGWEPTQIGKRWIPPLCYRSDVQIIMARGAGASDTINNISLMYFLTEGTRGRTWSLQKIPDKTRVVFLGYKAIGDSLFV